MKNYFNSKISSFNHRKTTSMLGHLLRVVKSKNQNNNNTNYVYIRHNETKRANGKTKKIEIEDIE